MPPDPGLPARAACIDIGSNGIRLVVAEHDGSATPRVLAQERAPVRLGASVFRTGSIDEAAMEGAIRALRGFRASLDLCAPVAVRALATSAVRDARNRKAFLRRARVDAWCALVPLGEHPDAPLRAVARRLLEGAVDGAQNGAAEAQDAGHVARRQSPRLFRIDEAVEAVFDAEHLDT